MKFKQKPIYLSPEHAAQVARFQGYPYDPEEDARLRAWAAFKRWEHEQFAARSRAPPPAGNARKKWGW